MDMENTLPRRKTPSEFAGLTILQIIEHPRGKLGRGLALVIVFTDKSWAGISVDVDGIGTDICGFLNFREWHSDAIADFLDPEQLFAAGLITQTQMLALLDLQKSADIEANEKRIASLRAQIANLEGEIQKISHQQPRSIERVA